MIFHALRRAATRGRKGKTTAMIKKIVFGVALAFFAVPLAAEETLKELRVLSYNIHICIGTDGKLDVKRTAETIMDQKPDLVALQEVDRKTGRVQNMDQVEELAKLTGMEVVFGKTVPVQGGDYGIAIMSRFPIRSHKATYLPNLDKEEERAALEAMIEIDENTVLRFVCTHFCYKLEKRRILQAEKINELFAADDQATILAGDFNAAPESETLAVLGKRWTNLTDRTPTFSDGKSKIDYIFCSPKGSFTLKETKVIPEKIASDHFPVLSVLDLRPQVAAR